MTGIQGLMVVGFFIFMIDFKQKLEEKDPESRNLHQAEEEEKFINDLKKNRKTKNYFIAIIVLVLIFSGKVIMSSQEAGQWLANNTFWGRVTHLAENNDNQLVGEEQDRINILLLGMGGANHDGGYLADTIILVSLRPSTKQAALLSIPRDLTVPTDNGVWRKVNSINALAEAKEEGSGGPAMTKSLSSVLGTDIYYYISIDFDGFINIIDELGGIDINVENTFDDYSFPIRGEEDNPDYYARFEHLHFDQGWQHMDGALALKYARSRHASGLEGSDFARAKRQQLILEAVKTKLLSRHTLLKPAMLSRIISELNHNVKTNLDVWALIKLWNDYKDIDRSQISNKVLNDGPNGLLMASRGENDAYILIPQTGNFKVIQNFVQNIFDENTNITTQNNQSEATKTPLESENSATNNPIAISKVQGEAKVAVLNGTWTSGLAAKTAANLQKYGFKINETANAPTREYKNSVIYDLTYGQKLQSLEILQAASQATLAYDAPTWLETYKNIPDKPDFILIIGAKQQ